MPADVVVCSQYKRFKTLNIYDYVEVSFDGQSPASAIPVVKDESVKVLEKDGLRIIPLFNKVTLTSVTPTAG